MSSPFPGMNPYFEHEDAWHEFHEHFLIHTREALNALVAPAYIVRTDSHVYLHEAPDTARRFVGRPDLAVAQAQAPSPSRATAGALEAPSWATLSPVDIEVRDRRTRRVVTVIELLSPANKRAGRDRDQYEAKREELLNSNAHFIELDLLRGWPRMPFEGLAECDYYAAVSRVETRPRVEIWPVRLRDPLPVIPVPLRSPDPDARLDLQALLHTVYDAGGYANYIYEMDPEPPLASHDAEWARQLLGR